jgi:hypothetical protein
MTQSFVYEVIEAIGIKTIKRTDENGIVVYIPTDPANSDYAAYLESLNDDTETE